MRKVSLFLSVFAVAVLASCGATEEKSVENADTTTKTEEIATDVLKDAEAMISEEVDSMVVDSVTTEVLDSTVTE